MLADMSQRLFARFGGPEGARRQVAGWIMARKNRALNAWITDLLAGGSGDRVIEVGFGPGLAVERNAARAACGLVAGVDRSEVMVRRARRRNAAAIAAGRVGLRVGDATGLPFDTASFSRGLAVDSLPFWSPAEAGLRELHRVLAPGARPAVAQAGGRALRPLALRHDRGPAGGVAGEPVTVEGDARMLRRLVRNLLDNAHRHGAGASVQCTVARGAGGRALLRVDDAGPGVPEAEHERIFEPFHRLPGTPGLGLGLALVRRIARHHGVEARCVARPGGGTRFDVALRGARSRCGKSVETCSREDLRRRRPGPWSFRCSHR
jgi:signal transduction histidine kinase